MSHSNIDKEEIEEEEMEEEEYEEEFRKIIKNLLIAVRAILQVLQELMVNMYNNQVQHPLSRRPKTSIGYDYVHRISTSVFSSFSRCPLSSSRFFRSRS